ncbi:unnamed protein product, partial [Polarella glacialis]
ARQQAQVKGVADNLASLQSEHRDVNVRTASQAAELVQLRGSMASLQRNSGMGAASQPPSPAGSQPRVGMGVHQDQQAQSAAPGSSVKLAALEARLHRLEEHGEPVPPGLGERLRLLEESGSRSSSTQMLSSQAAATAASAAAEVL